jgi:zinc D-Ala-D-Ala dipeptidase
MLTRIASALLFVSLSTGCVSANHSQNIGVPDGFVHLSLVDPTIQQDMRYARTQNFIGRRIAGYEAPECIVTKPTAEALQKAQTALRPSGYTLVMFDCYRPARALADFMAWTATPGPADREWRPGLSKDRLVPDGYIAARSGHSRGSTVDLGLARVAPRDYKQTRRTSPCARMDRNTVDMGTPFDCFHPASATADTSISLVGQANRQVLLAAMTAAGFRNYAAEWWHFTLINEPFPDQYFDFPVTAPVR